MGIERAALTAIAVVLGIALAAGCSTGLCGRNSDCAAGEICTGVGQCAIPPADAATDDASEGSGVDVIDNNSRERGEPIAAGSP